jgi:carboxylesterase type B
MFNNRAASSDKMGGASVAVWIFGGGFYEGSKQSQGNPAGIILQSRTNPSAKPTVYVAMNYRLGFLGFLAGPSFASGGGTPNDGLDDQRLALEWIHENMHLFGGDQNRVTIMGASAGAASGMH